MKSLHHGVFAQNLSHMHKTLVFAATRKLSMILFSIHPTEFHPFVCFICKILFFRPVPSSVHKWVIISVIMNTMRMVLSSFWFHLSVTFEYWLISLLDIKSMIVENNLTVAVDQKTWWLMNQKLAAHTQLHFSLDSWFFLF